MGVEVRHVQQDNVADVTEPHVSHRAPSRMSKKARRRSPAQFKESTVTNMARAGQSETPGACWRTDFPSLIIPPQVGVGRGTERPRKARLPSATMAKPIPPPETAQGGGTTVGKH